MIDVTTANRIWMVANGKSAADKREMRDLMLAMMKELGIDKAEGAVDFASKSRSLSDAIEELAGQVSSAAGAIDDVEGRLDTIEGKVKSARSVLESIANRLRDAWNVAVRET